MATRQGSDKDKFFFFFLNKEHGYAASRIAKFMNWGETTIRTWIKEVDYQKQIFDLTAQLNEARALADTTREYINIRELM